MTLKSTVKLIEKPNYEDNVEVFTVEGTPADCVILACEKIFNTPPKLIVSGINSGANLGLDVMLSGTVGAAIHGYLRNIPSIAISSSYKSESELRFDVAGLIIEQLVMNSTKKISSKPFLLNVNVPSVNLDVIKKLKLTFLGKSNYQQNIEKDHTSEQQNFWIKPDKKNYEKPAVGSDIWAVEKNYISITKIEPFYSSILDDSIISDIIEIINLKYFK
tara:strand:+ start:12397 stop:13050 length:654 start_codon:yes stop_codon:yes gene_type:complete